jgi:hypothetical protein
MSSLELRLQTLRKAIKAFREAPGRVGRLVELNDAEDVLIGGDMHGHVANFQRLMQKAELGKHPRRHLVVQELIHGPFHHPSGGDKSHQLLDLVCALKCQFPRQVHFLLGNHELAQATNQMVSKQDTDLNELFLQGVRTTYGSRGDEVYGVYLELFAIAPFALRTPGRTFISHSLPSLGALPGLDLAALTRDPTSDEDLQPGGPLYSLVWGRDVRPETVSEFLSKVDADILISGHIPCEGGHERPSPRHVILDSQGEPAGYCLIPANRPVTPEELSEFVHLL